MRILEDLLALLFFSFRREATATAGVATDTALVTRRFSPGWLFVNPLAAAREIFCERPV